MRQRHFHGIRVVSIDGRAAINEEGSDPDMNSSVQGECWEPTKRRHGLTSPAWFAFEVDQEPASENANSRWRNLHRFMARLKTAPAIRRTGAA
jgi:hypothetical protein